MDAATSLTGYRRLGGVMFVLVFSGCTTTDTVMMQHPQTHEIARRELRVVAGSLAVQIQALEMKTAKDLAGAFEAENKRPSEALIVLSNPLTLASRIQIAASAAKRRLPAMYLYRAHVEAGGLLSYGPNLPDVSALQRVRGSGPGRRQTGRAAAGASGKVRDGDQSQVRQGIGPCNAAITPPASGSGHRVTPRPRWLVVCSCGWTRESSSAWTAKSMSRLRRS